MPTRDEDFRYGVSQAELSRMVLGVDLAHEGEYTFNTEGLNDIVFSAVDLVFKEDGRIILRGREIHNDLELVNALRQSFGLTQLTQLDQTVRNISERLAENVDREIIRVLDESAYIEEGDLVKFTEEKLQPTEEEELYIEI